ncbi:hypothetical protein [Cohnella sp. GCM10012308]|uniref:hypothetical protein n=1 Tax=Cohnella sp. GCM10012308 TaxID=3317329 RepID=UPI0036126A64
MGIEAVLIGAELFCVTFVRDYVQFGFHCKSEDASLSAYTLPKVTVKGKQYAFADIGYRDALCGLINQTVEAVSIMAGISIKIKFKNSDELLIKLTDTEHKTLVEFAQFQCGDIVQVWN